jgi:ABC-type arginine transport system permease subunit
MLELYIISVILAIGLSYFVCSYKLEGRFYMLNIGQLFTIIIVGLLPILNLIVIVFALFYILSETDN